MSNLSNKLSVIKNLTILERQLHELEINFLEESPSPDRIDELNRFVIDAQAELNPTSYQPQVDLLNLMGIGLRKSLRNKSQFSDLYIDLCCCGIETILVSLETDQQNEKLEWIKEEFLGYLGKQEVFI
jgi:hypothetical protein